MPVTQNPTPKHLARETMALILAGGRGSRLHELTEWRAKPALYFGGKFRLIDFPLSNCVNSGIRRISVLTQYKAHSLIRHLVRGWSSFQNSLGEFIEVLPASQRTNEGWYAGTADAIYQNLDIILSTRPSYILVLSGDHIYKMDYGEMLASHVAHGADMTVCCLEVPLEEATEFGVIGVEESGRVASFEEKPSHPTPMPGSDESALVSMGNYVFNTDFLFEQLERDSNNPASSHDFGKDIIPSLIGGNGVYAYRFGEGLERQPYWRDVGTLDSFWQANIDLTDVTPELNLYDESWPILTAFSQLPAAKFVFRGEEKQGMALDSVVSGGCIVSGAVIVRSLLFTNVRVHSYARMKDTVVLPDVEIGQGCRIRRAIIDRGCRVPEGTVIGEDAEEDARRYRVTRKGIVLVTREMLGQPPRNTLAGSLPVGPG